MARKTINFDAVSVLQIVVAVFLFTLGLIGIIDWNSDPRSSAGASTACSDARTTR